MLDRDHCAGRCGALSVRVDDGIDLLGEVALEIEGT